MKQAAKRAVVEQVFSRILPAEAAPRLSAGDHVQALRRARQNAELAFKNINEAMFGPDAEPMGRLRLAFEQLGTAQVALKELLS